MVTASLRWLPQKQSIRSSGLSRRSGRQAYSDRFFGRHFLSLSPCSLSLSIYLSFLFISARLSIYNTPHVRVWNYSIFVTFCWCFVFYSINRHDHRIGGARKKKTNKQKPKQLDKLRRSTRRYRSYARSRRISRSAAAEALKYRWPQANGALSGRDKL